MGICAFQIAHSFLHGMLHWRLSSNTAVVCLNQHFQTAWKREVKEWGGSRGWCWGQAAVCPLRDHHWHHCSHSLCQGWNLAKIKLEWGKGNLAGQFSFLYLLKKISIYVLFKIHYLFTFFFVISSATLGNKLQTGDFTFKLSLSFSGLEIFGFKDSHI